MVRRLVVVGGGISGLAAAWSAQQAAGRVPGGLEVVVLERAAAVGGKARSVRSGAWLVECGPSGFPGGCPEMQRLIAGAGMSGAMIPAAPASARRFIFTRGRMREVKANPVALVRSGILSARGGARMLAEMFIGSRQGDAEESVWEFACRRFGAEVAEQIVAPLTLGVFAGDARRLSLSAAFPRMATLEHEHGSLIRAVIGGRGRMSPGALTSFREGMQSLPQALASRGGFTVRCGAEARALERRGERWAIAVAGDADSIVADAVVFAAEPWATAELLRSCIPIAAAQLDAIPCPAVAVVALGFGPDALARVPRGFGVLVARGEGFRMLGNLWEAHVYPGRSPDGHLLVRAIFGGAADPGVGSLGTAELAALTRAEIARLYGITGEPVFEHVERVPKAIPQYEIGHRDRVAAVERALAALPGVDITGFGLRGVAFADAAADGVRTGERIIEQMHR